MSAVASGRDYDYHYLCTELRRKRMIPVLTKIRAKTLQQFGDLVRHAGEEFLYVVKGRVVVHTEFYDPTTLDEGHSMYIDSTMGHAYLVGEGHDDAEILGVMSSADETLMEAMLSLHEERRQSAIAANEDAPVRRAKRTAAGAT